VHWSFLWRPRWLVAHLLVVVTVVGFVNLGLWQLRRLDERRAANAEVTAGLAADEAPLAALLADGDASEYRRAQVRGRYRPGDEVLWAYRTRDGRPGHEVLTPLETTDGLLVVVDRGWVPLDLGDPPITAAAPPGGNVVVTGLVRNSLPVRGSTPDDETLVASVDLDLLADRWGRDVAPVWLQLQSQQPAQSGDLPLAPTPPALSEGSHLSYAFQWFAFALTAAVGYPLLLRRAAREH
jgi:cytochrome oxidase assembly protein ShyY1